MRREILVGDALDVLKGLEADTVDCIVTSPPYWGLRDYGVEGQLGLEPTWREHLQRLLPIFAECKRVLKPTGNLWVNYGDTVVQSSHANRGNHLDGKRLPEQGADTRHNLATTGNGPVKHKIGLAWRLRFALNDELGWISRSDVVWHKRNTMPLSMGDRLTPKHEALFHFVKNVGTPLFYAHRDGKTYSGDGRPTPDYRWIYKPTKQRFMEPPPGWESDPDWRRINLWEGHDYFFDLDSIRRPFASTSPHDSWQARVARGGVKGGAPGQRPNAFQRPLGGSNVAGFNIRVRDAQKGRLDGKWGDLARATDEEVANYVERPLAPRRDKTLGHDGTPNSAGLRLAPEPGEEGAFHPLGANPGDVWDIPNEPLKEAHFATFPSELARRCLMAGCPERVCAQCGKPWTREYVSEMVWSRGAYRGINSRREQVAEAVGSHESRGDGMVGTGVAVHHAAGWKAPCDHATYVPGLALDPFAGSGTVGVAAAGLGLQFVLVELKAEYAEIARRRLGPALNPLNVFGGA